MKLNEARQAEAAFGEILYTARFGEVVGIRFDLRNPALDPSIWVPMGTIQGVSFPWSEPIANAWRKLIEENEEFIEVEEVESVAIVEPLDIDDIAIRPGDRVYVSRVTALGRSRTPIDEQTDTESRWAYLRVDTADGRTIPVPEPVGFVARTAMQAHSLYLESPDDDPDLNDFLAPYAITFEKIAKRIELLDDRKYEEWTRLATWALMYANEEIEEIRGKLPLDGVHLIDLVATAAYALAKAETQARVVPFALKAVSSVEGGRKGGKKSGESRRQKNTENWEADALKIANRIRSKQEWRPQKELASDIQNAWTREDSEPGYQWLLDLIRDAEKDGRLPPRKGRKPSAMRNGKGVQ